MATAMLAIAGTSVPAHARCTSHAPTPLRLHPSRPTSLRPFTSRAAPHERTRPVQTSALFDLFKKKAPAKAAAPARPTIVPEPSYNIPAVLLATSALSASQGATPVAAVTGVLGAFLAFQASRVKFVFGPDALEVLIGETESENKFVGGENKWAYDTFTNWEFWWPGFPVLVYFKETQTKPEGQIHFFPVIFNGKQVYDAMVERCGESQTSGPK